MSVPKLMRVIHFGLVGDRPGGMAQVVNEYLRWSEPGLSVSAVATARFKRDPLSAVLFPAAVVRLLTFAIRSRRTTQVTVFHLSENGSFIREGLLLVVARLLRLNAIAHLHGANFADFAMRRPSLVRFVLGSASTVAVLTLDDELTVVKMLRPNARVVVVPNVVPVPKSHVEKTSTLVFGGELSPRKGFDVLCEAWSDLYGEFPSWTLCVAGPSVVGQDMPRLDGITYLGVLPNASLLTHLDKAKVAVLPSRNEALPMFLLEAMARGCAIVSTNVGQITTLLEGDAGIVVEAGNAVSLRSALRTLMADDSTRLVYSDRSRRRVQERYSVEHARVQIVDLWRSVAAGN
jgi:glycosyltransferase involved in cell wall biosynthesis